MILAIQEFFLITGSIIRNDLILDIICWQISDPIPTIIRLLIKFSNIF